jgi:hypothetical protein
MKEEGRAEDILEGKERQPCKNRERRRKEDTKVGPDQVATE